MLFIEENEVIALPKEHHEIHNFCAVVYDQLTEIMIGEIYENARTTEFNIKETHALIEELHSERIHVLDWFTHNNMNNELTTSLSKHVALYLMQDFVHFIYEALNTAKKGKLTVSYALLRKPLTDVLLLLEQILLDKEDFINRFYYQGAPSKYMPESDKFDKEDIISKTIGKISSGAMFDAKFIYQLRYDKTCSFGLNGISNQALHIVTNKGNYKIEDRNLNFIFSDELSMKSQWAHFYHFVPMLLLYAVSVIDELFFEYLPEHKLVKDAKAIKRFIIFILWGSSINNESQTNEISVIDEVSELLEYKCKKCDSKLEFTNADFKEFIFTESLQCNHCLTDQFADAEFADKFYNIWKSILSL